MPQLQVSPFHTVCAVLGTVLFVFSFVSYLVKERLYVSESLISLLAGVIVSPHATNIVNPRDHVDQNDGLTTQRLESTTRDFTRLALSIQVCLAGVQLPARYARSEWRSLTALLGPGMVAMWLISSLFIWAISSVRGTDAAEDVKMPFLHALAIAACITPTDPVLSNTIVKGRWAQMHVSSPIAQLISAESGANDGLGYPFIFFALYLIKYLGTRQDTGAPGDDWAAGPWGGARSAMGMWFGETWLYIILMSVVWGAVIGAFARKFLKIGRHLGYVDMESFFSFTIVMAVFIIGTCGMVGSDDVLACFVAGNALSWDNWFRERTLYDSFEPTIDMLLNITLFIWFGAVCPWPLFVSSTIPLWRLIVIAIVILLLRRPPVLFALHKLKLVRQVKGVRQALFIGFFGPIGVSAIFYQHLILEFIHLHLSSTREDAQLLRETVEVIVWFMVISSTAVHGLSIPIYQAGLYVLHHAKPHWFDEEERYHISDVVRREKEYIERRPWVHRLEHDMERAVELGVPRAVHRFRRVKTEGSNASSYGH